MMRNFEDRKAEVLRRSEARLRQRRRTQKQLLLVIPLVCIVLGTVVFLPRLLPMGGASSDAAAAADVAFENQMMEAADDAMPIDDAAEEPAAEEAAAGELPVEDAADAVEDAISGKSQTTQEQPTEAFVQNGYGYANMSLLKLENWEYETTAYSEEMDGFGITFWPKDQSVGSITLFYYDFWGVCGTGLEEKTVSIGTYEAWMGTYDNHALWDFISVKNMPGHYVFLNNGAESWWAEYAGEAMRIIESAVLAEGIMTEEQAVALAMAAVTEQGVYEAGYCSFDNDTGIWEIQLNALNNAGADYTLHVFPDETTEIVEAVIYD